MSSMRQRIFFFITASVLVLCSALGFLFHRETKCVMRIVEKYHMSSHGWRVFASDTFASMGHEGERMCIAPGFEPVGEVMRTQTYAVFPQGSSAVFIRSDAFRREHLAPEGSANSEAVSVIFSNALTEEEREQYRKAISHSFTGMQPLFPGQKIVSPHTVLVTVRVAGDAMTFEDSVYPDPGANLSVFVRNLNHPRGEELFTHAIAHYFNRFTEKNDSSPTEDALLSAEDWQEMEASWIELYLSTDRERLSTRVNQLHAVHTAVLERVWSPDLIYPFSERALFDAVSTTTVAPSHTAHYSDVQYGHYVLAPLILLAVDGLLARELSDQGEAQGAHDSVATLISLVHTELGTDIFSELAKRLSAEALADLHAWMFEGKQIPIELILEGVARIHT
jgi:hypothetical protein